MGNWTDPFSTGTLGFLLGGVLYASVWLAIFESGSSLLFYAWIVGGGVALGGLAGFALGQERLISPLVIAMIVLLLGLIPSHTGPDSPPASPGLLSVVFLFGWPVLLGLSGLFFRIEKSTLS